MKEKKEKLLQLFTDMAEKYQDAERGCLENQDLSCFDEDDLDELKEKVKKSIEEFKAVLDDDEWIPVTERLPEETQKCYRTTYAFKVLGITHYHVTDDYYNIDIDGERRWELEKRGFGYKVVAWKPKEEPYMGKKAELYITHPETGKKIKLGAIRSMEMETDLKCTESFFDHVPVIAEYETPLLPAEKPLNYNLHDLTLTDNQPRKKRKATKKKYRYKKRRK